MNDESRIGRRKTEVISTQIMDRNRRTHTQKNRYSKSTKIKKIVELKRIVTAWLQIKKTSNPRRKMGYT